MIVESLQQAFQASNSFTNKNWSNWVIKMSAMLLL